MSLFWTERGEATGQNRPLISVLGPRVRQLSWRTCGTQGLRYDTAFPLARQPTVVASQSRSRWEGRLTGTTRSSRTPHTLKLIPAPVVPRAVGHVLQIASLSHFANPSPSVSQRTYHLRSGSPSLCLVRTALDFSSGKITSKSVRALKPPYKQEVHHGSREMGPLARVRTDG
jgi:hypothetical protein